MEIDEISIVKKHIYVLIDLLLFKARYAHDIILLPVYCYVIIYLFNIRS